VPASRSCIRLTTVALTVFALTAAVPAVAFGQAPENDNYLSGLGPQTLVPGLPFEDTVSTAQATEQADVFAPEFGGGGPAEDTTCPNEGGVSVFGKTVWYFLDPPLPGVVFIEANGFDTVVGLVPFDRNTLIPNFGASPCQDDPDSIAGEFAIFDVDARPYAIQVGGFAGYNGVPANAESGLLEFTFTYYGDRDRDGVYEAPWSPGDQCPNEAGPEQFNGCPDSDRDGIPDIRDDCDQQGGPAQHTGCPDADGDGVPDIRDDCDLQRGPAQHTGCPDADGDGIPDIRDDCDNEDASGRDKNRNGCLDKINLADRVNGGVDFARANGKIRVRKVTLVGVPDGARITGICQAKTPAGRFRNCGSIARTARSEAVVSLRSLAKAHAAKTLRLRNLVRARLGVGSRIVIRVTAQRAIGRYLRWTVVREGGALTTKKFEGCMNVGQRVRFKARGCR
jgi:hypothetical protein